MADVVVRMTIPIPVGPGVGAPALTFSHWLPLGDEQAIEVAENDIALKLWFDITSTYWASHAKEEDLPRMVNVLAHRMHAAVTITGVRPELVTYIRTQDRTRHPTPEEQPLYEECSLLAERVLQFTLGNVNRLISYVRSTKGQHWLREYELTETRASDFFRECEAVAHADGVSFPFGQGGTVHLKVVLPDESRLITAEEWEGIRAFVRSKRRSPLAPMLLADAEALAAMGHRRSALVQSVTALEVTLSEFGRNPHAERAFGPTFAPRFGGAKLSTQVEHMGLSGSVNYLLPVLFPETDLPQAVVELCRKAIEQRNNIVHMGQRDVAEDLLLKMLRAIRTLCTLLDRNTKPADANLDAPQE